MLASARPSEGTSSRARQDGGGVVIGRSMVGGAPGVLPPDGTEVRLGATSADPYVPTSNKPNRTPRPQSVPSAGPMMERRTKDMASMAVNELGPMLTATEVAEMLHLHVNTVKRLGDRGELPFYRVCKRGDRRFRLEDVLRFLHQNR